MFGSGWEATLRHVLRYIPVVFIALVLVACGTGGPEDVDGVAAPVGGVQISPPDASRSSSPSATSKARKRPADSTPQRDGNASDPGSGSDGPAANAPSGSDETDSPAADPPAAPDMSACSGARNVRKDGTEAVSLYRKRDGEELYYVGWMEWKIQRTRGCDGAQWLYIHPTAQVGNLHTTLTRTADGDAQTETLNNVHSGETVAPPYIYAGDGSRICAKLWTADATYVTKGSSTFCG